MLDIERVFADSNYMIDQGFVVIESFLRAYGIPVIFLIGFFEEIFFFIPSAFVFIALGFIMIDPRAALWPALGTAFFDISLVTSAGVTVGALCIYGLIYRWGKPFIERYGKYARVSWSDLQGFERWFERGYADEAVLVFFRAIPIFPITVVSIFCGLIRIPFLEFTWTTFIGTILRVTGLALLGWYAGKEYFKYVEQIAAVEQYILLFAFLIIIGLFAMRLYRHRH